jgi:uncharacterized membrane protein
MKKYLWLKAIGLVAAIVSIVGSFFSIGLTELHLTKLMLVAMLLLLGSDNAELRERLNESAVRGSKLFKIGMTILLIGFGLSGFFGG